MKRLMEDHPLSVKIISNILFAIYLPFGLLVEFIHLCKHIYKCWNKGFDKAKQIMDKINKT